MKKPNFVFPKQYAHMSSANRAIKRYQRRSGTHRFNFSINKIDEGCFEVEVFLKKKEV